MLKTKLSCCEEGYDDEYQILKLDENNAYWKYIIGPNFDMKIPNLVKMVSVYLNMPKRRLVRSMHDHIVEGVLGV